MPVIVQPTAVKVNVFVNGGSNTALYNPMTTLGDLIVGGLSGTPTRLGLGTNGQILGISGGNIAWVSPTNLTLTNGHIFVGNGSNIATDVLLTGDASILNTGALTVTAIQGKGITLASGYLKYNGSSFTFDNSTFLTTISGIAAGGDLSGTYTTPTVSKLLGNTIPANAAGALTNNGSGTLSWQTYITGNQTITLTGDVMGSGTTSIPSTVGAIQGKSISLSPGYLKYSGTAFSFDNSTFLTTISGITAGGDLYGTYPNPIVTQLLGHPIPANAAGALTNDGYGNFSWLPSVGTGTVTSTSVVSANGFAGTVGTPSTTPAITLSTTITGILKGNGTAISAAVAGTDYLAPSSVWTLAGGGTLTGVNTITSNVGSQLLFTGTWTALTTNNNHVEWSGSITARTTASDNLRYFLIDPTITAAANTQKLTALSINPTFIPGAYTGIVQYILDLKNAGTSVLSVDHNGQFILTQAALSNLTAEQTDVLFNGARAVQWNTTGTIAVQRFNYFEAPTSLFGAGPGPTYFTNMYNVYIDGLPATTGVATSYGTWALGLGGALKLSASNASWPAANIPSGAFTTTTSDGNIEYNGTHLYFSIGSTRYQIDQQSVVGMTNPMTTTGDIIYSSPGSTPVRLGIGSTSQVLTVVGGVPAWAAAGSGGFYQTIESLGSALTQRNTFNFTDGITALDNSGSTRTDISLGGISSSTVNLNVAGAGVSRWINQDNSTTSTPNALYIFASKFNLYNQPSITIASESTLSTWRPQINISSGSAYLGFNAQKLTGDPSYGQVVFVDGRPTANRVGIEYNADYSATMIPLSLIHKGYVDGNFWKTSGTTTLAGNVTIAQNNFNTSFTGFGKVTFNPTSVGAGINVGVYPVSYGIVGSPVNGDIWSIGNYSPYNFYGVVGGNTNYFLMASKSSSGYHQIPFGQTGSSGTLTYSSNLTFDGSYLGTSSINIIGVSTLKAPLLTGNGFAFTALPASTELSDIKFNLNRTVQFATGALSLQRAIVDYAPTYSFVAASTLSLAATHSIAGAPLGGTNATLTNSTALNIETSVLTGVTNGYGVISNAPTGATNNYALKITGAIDLGGTGAGTVGQVLVSGGAGSSPTWGAGGSGWALTGTSTLTGAATIVGTSSNTITYQFQSLGTTVTNGAGAWYQNSTAATLGNQQISPSTVWEGQQWQTTAGASQSVKFAAYVLPLQSTVNDGTWYLDFSGNGGAYTHSLSMRYTSGLTINANPSAGTPAVLTLQSLASNVMSFSANYILWQGQNTVYSISSNAQTGANTNGYDFTISGQAGGPGTANGGKLILSPGGKGASSGSNGRIDLQFVSGGGGGSTRMWETDIANEIWLQINSSNSLIFASKNAASTSQFLIQGAQGISGSTSGNDLVLQGGAGYGVGTTNGGNLNLVSGVPNSGGTEGAVNIQTRATGLIGFWNVTPITRPTTSIAASTFVANTSGTVNDSATWDGYTIGQIVKALRNLGLIN